MRVLIATALAGLLFSTNLMSAETTALAPGNVAGVKKAQDENGHPFFWILGGAAVFGIVVLAMGQSNWVATTTTSSTATSP